MKSTLFTGTKKHCKSVADIEIEESETKDVQET